MAKFAQPIPAGRLEYEMTVRGLRPAQVAFEAGVNPSTISRAKNGKPVQLETLLRISTVIASHPVVEAMANLMDEGA